MADPTPQELAQAAQKQDAMKQAQAMAEQMSLVAQFLDAGLRLFVNHPLLQADVLTSLAAGQCVRNGLKDEQIVAQFRTKCMYARRAEKMNAKLSQEVPEVIPDAVASQLVTATGPDGQPIQIKVVSDDAVGPGAAPHDDPELEPEKVKLSIVPGTGEVVDVSTSRIIKP